MRKPLMLMVFLFASVFLSAQTEDMESQMIGSWQIIPMFSVDNSDDGLHVSLYDFDHDENGGLTFYANGTGVVSAGNDNIKFNWKFDEENNLSIAYQDFASLSALRRIDSDTIIMFENQSVRGYVVLLKRNREQ